MGLESFLTMFKGKVNLSTKEITIEESGGVNNMAPSFSTIKNSELIVYSKKENKKEFIEYFKEIIKDKLSDIIKTVENYNEL